MFTELPESLVQYMTPKGRAIREAALRGDRAEASRLTMEYAREIHQKDTRQTIQLDFNPEAL